MEETRGYYQGLANRIRVDMDSRSPRLRLSVIGYLVDGGVTPESVGGTSKWLEFIDKTVAFVGADLEIFADDVAELPPPEKGEEGEADSNDKDGYDVMKDGKGYL